MCLKKKISNKKKVLSILTLLIKFIGYIIVLKLNDKLNFVKKVLPDTTNIIFNIKNKKL